MKAKLIKKGDGYYLNDISSDWWIGDTDHEKVKSHKGEQILSKLSLKNCQAIERGYDLDELASKYQDKTWPNMVKFIDVNKSIYKECFQEALEILGDRRFTEEDMMNLGEYVWKYGGRERSMNQLLDDYKAPQQNEWEVEVLDERDSEGRLILKHVV